MKICVIVPVYNHHKALKKVIERLRPLALHCFLINDGSSVECSAILNNIAKEESRWLTLYDRDSNGGKGAAVIDGFLLAIRNGFSHAIQIDADGQHKIEDISHFVSISNSHPNHLILGKPCFDDTVPRKRLYGRMVTNLWIWINTLSFAINDGMCGFRCYPLLAVESLLSSTRIAHQMDFDIDIVVQLYWHGLDIINIPTDVHYPEDGISHFRMLWDNLLISLKHAQLFLGMILRLPKLVGRHLS